MLLADSCNICSDALIPFEHFTPRDKDFHLLWELARFLVMLCACSMASLCALTLIRTLALALALALALTLTLTLTLNLTITITITTVIITVLSMLEHS